MTVTQTRRRRLFLSTVWLLLTVCLIVVVGVPATTWVRIAVVGTWALIVAIATEIHRFLQHGPTSERGAAAGASEQDQQPSSSKSSPVVVSVIPRAAAAAGVASVISFALEFVVDGRFLFGGALVIFPQIILLAAPVRKASSPKRPPRHVGHRRLVVVETALPVAFVSTSFGALIALARIDAGWVPTPNLFARHLAVTVVLYAVLLSVGAFFKVARERASGHVVVDRAEREPPSAAVIGAVIGVAMLFFVPVVVKETPSVFVVATVKAMLAFVSAMVFSSLGAWRALALNDAQLARLAPRALPSSAKDRSDDDVVR